MAVKFGRDSELLVEAETMQFLHAHLGASVPCVSSTLIEDCPQEDALATKCYYLILEDILGKSYLEESLSLTPADKADIQRQLRSIMDELRAIPSPGYYIRAGRRPLYDLILNYYDREGPTTRGPFATEEDWNNGIILLTDRLPNQFHARVHRRSSSDAFHQLANRRFLHPHIRYPLALRSERGARCCVRGFWRWYDRASVFSARTNPVHDAYSGPPSLDGHLHQAAEAARAAAGTVRISGYVGRFRR